MGYLSTWTIARVFISIYIWHYMGLASTYGIIWAIYRHRPLSAAYIALMEDIMCAMHGYRQLLMGSIASIDDI